MLASSSMLPRCQAFGTNTATHRHHLQPQPGACCSRAPRRTDGCRQHSMLCADGAIPAGASHCQTHVNGKHTLPTLGQQAIRKSRLACASPKFNPQNVEDPLVMPSTSFSPEECVRAQLDAMMNNDEPWTNHGIQTLYVFCEDAGGMERSYYFGFSKDLYHQDHFMGMVGNLLGGLIDCQEYTVASQEQRQDGSAVVRVAVTKDSRGFDAGEFEVVLVKRQIGRHKGAWMTKSLKPLVAATSSPA